jgi:Protein of unknown function (DUF4236)
MGFGFRKRIGLGRFLGINVSKRGVSLSGRLGPLSSNTRTRRLRVRLPFGGWWQSKKLGS